MAYNNGFPMAYSQMAYPGYQVPQQIQQPQQAMTQPTIHAEIIQIPSEKDAWNQPVAAGASHMMITRDEKYIFIKSAYPNSQPTLDVYERQAPRRPEGASDYVTLEEFTRAIEALKTPSEAKTEGVSE